MRRKQIVFLFVLIVVFLVATVAIFVGIQSTDEARFTFCSSLNGWSEDDLENGIYQLDIEYANRKQNIKSNAQLTNLNEEFRDLWKNKIDEYCQILKSGYNTRNSFYSDELNAEMIRKTMVMQKEWEVFYEKQVNYYKDFLASVYSSGSIIPIYSSEYDLTLCRNRAIELYRLCQILGVNVVAP